VSEQSSEFVVVLCTAPDAETAGRIARVLVERRLAACANIVSGLTSVFRWEGAIQDDAEVLLVIKSRRELFERLEAAIADEHPYDVPEILALPVLAGSTAYLSWLSAETTP
jgi:periplasmic divalent cation tolerance protein